MWAVDVLAWWVLVVAGLGFLGFVADEFSRADPPNVR